MEENRNEMEMNNIETSTNDVVESNCYEENSGSAGDALLAALIIAGSAAVGCAAYEGAKKLFKFGKKKAESIRTKREAAKFVDAEKVNTTVVEDETK